MEKNIFKATAQSELSLSWVMEGREKLTTEEVSTGEALTVDEFDIADLDGKKFGVVHFVEYPDRYYNGGKVLTKLCSAWAGLFDGDTHAASTALAKQGGVQLVFKTGKTKSGNNVTTMEVL